MTENYDGFGGSGIFFAFLIFALFAFGGNGGGWGWGGRGGALSGAGAGIQSALCQGFAGINQTVNNTAAAAALQTSAQTREIVNAIVTGNAALSNKIDQNTISALQTENARLYADKSNLLQSINFGERFCGLEKQLAACCCSTQNDLNLILSKLPTSGTAAA